MIAFKQLCVKRGETLLLENITFAIEGKGVHGVLGPKGAGKSALAGALLGEYAPASGELLWDESPAEADERDILSRKRKIGYMPTDLSAYGDMTLLEVMEFVGSAKRVEPERLFRQSMEALRLVELEAYAACLVDRLNRGNARRFAIALALIGGPELLILDEPTSGLGVTAAEELRAIIELLGTKKCILLLTRFPNEVETLCTDFLMLSKGKQILFDSVERVLARLRREDGGSLTLEEAFLTLTEPAPRVEEAENQKRRGGTR